MDWIAAFYTSTSAFRQQRRDTLHKIGKVHLSLLLSCTHSKHVITCSDARSACFTPFTDSPGLDSRVHLLPVARDVTDSMYLSCYTSCFGGFVTKNYKTASNDLRHVGPSVCRRVTREKVSGVSLNFALACFTQIFRQTVDNWHCTWYTICGLHAVQL